MSDDPQALAARLVQQSRDALQRKDTAAAEGCLLQAMEIEPRNPRHPAVLASVFLRHGQHSLAVVYGQIATTLAPESDNYQRILGAIWDAAGERHVARSCYIAAARLNPSEPRNWIALARIEREGGEFQVAEAHARRAVSLAPTGAEALAEHGRALHACDRLDEATQLLRHAASIAPDDGSYQYYLGVVLAESGHLREALSTLDGALRLKQDQPMCLVALARVRQGLGQAKEAQRALNRARQLEPLQAREFKRIFETPLKGVTAQQAGAPAHAMPLPAVQPRVIDDAPANTIECLETELARGATDAMTYQALSLAYVKAGRVQEALGAARKAEEIRQRRR